MNVSLGPSFEKFVEKLLISGRYVSSSEVVRASLRLLMIEEQAAQAKLKDLRAAVNVGLDQAKRGEFVDLNLGEILAAASSTKRRPKARK
jgi:antitoxin ParD1/3/4